MVYATIRQHGDAVAAERAVDQEVKSITEKGEAFNLNGKELARSQQGAWRGLSYVLTDAGRELQAD